MGRATGVLRIPFIERLDGHYLTALSQNEEGATDLFLAFFVLCVFIV